ncbi:MAG: discoidin domain-containing protein [Thermoflexales bacterium]|nr:discoidin domain-containing protein [Thermoflexales bacterium]
MMKPGPLLLIVALLFALSACASTPKVAATPAVALPTTWGQDVAADRPIIAHAGGITYEGWGNANDAIDYSTPTRRPAGGRWGHNTNGGAGTYAVVDLGRIYQLAAVGYSLDWDGGFQNSLTVKVDVSIDNETWTTVSQQVHHYSTPHVSNHVDLDLAIELCTARYVKFSEPPDGAWNGWGTFFQLRAYAAADE